LCVYCVDIVTKLVPWIPHSVRVHIGEIKDSVLQVVSELWLDFTDLVTNLSKICKFLKPWFFQNLNILLRKYYFIDLNEFWWIKTCVFERVLFLNGFTSFPKHHIRNISQCMLFLVSFINFRQELDNSKSTGEEVISGEEQIFRRRGHLFALFW